MLFFTEKNKAEPQTPERPGGRRPRRTRRGEQQASRPESPPVNSPPSSLEYESIRQDPELEGIQQTFTEDHQFKYGTPNPSLPPTKVACGGCGALLHARQARFPSYFQQCCGSGSASTHTIVLVPDSQFQRSNLRLFMIYCTFFVPYRYPTGRLVKQVIYTNMFISCGNFKHYTIMQFCGSCSALI